MSRFLDFILKSLSSLSGILIVFILLSGTCVVSCLTYEPLGNAMITKDQAAQEFLNSTIKNITASSLRVNQYPNLLDTGVRVREAYIQKDNSSGYLLCEHPSWLFFVDLAPNAHFAHPVIISILDAATGKIKSIDAEWWPVLESPIFDTEAKRNDSSTVVYER